MALYRDQNNHLHDDMAGTATHLLPAGCVQITDAEADAIRNPPPTPEQIKADIIAATQVRLDSFARTRGYDGIMSACTYSADSNTKFAAEGQYCVAKRGETWAKVYAMEAEVLAGTRPMPASFADVEPELPVLEWPV